jgi:hypothetical protein
MGGEDEGSVFTSASPQTPLSSFLQLSPRRRLILRNRAVLQEVQGGMDERAESLPYLRLPPGFKPTTLMTGLLSQGHTALCLAPASYVCEHTASTVTTKAMAGAKTLTRAHPVMKCRQWGGLRSDEEPGSEDIPLWKEELWSPFKRGIARLS